MGCDYLEPIKGIGPSTAYKLMKEHGSLKHVVAHLRGKQAARDGEVAAAVAEESEEEEEEVVESEKESEDGHGEQGLDEEDKVDEEEGGSIKKGGKKRARVTDDSDEDNDNDDFPPPSKAGNSDSDADEDNPEPSASKTKGKGKASPVKKSTKKAAPKVAGGGGKKAAPKKRGGIIIPEDWNWQGAKELFLRPDVVKSTDVEVRPSLFGTLLSSFLLSTLKLIDPPTPFTQFAFACQIEWTAPDVEGLVDFLVREKGFRCVSIFLSFFFHINDFPWQSLHFPSIANPLYRSPPSLPSLPLSLPLCPFSPSLPLSCLPNPTLRDCLHGFLPHSFQRGPSPQWRRQAPEDDQRQTARPPRRFLQSPAQGSLQQEGS
jgi:hypothetical protein